MPAALSPALFFASDAHLSVALAQIRTDISPLNNHSFLATARFRFILKNEHFLSIGGD